MSSNSEKLKGIIGKTSKDGLPVIWKFVNEEPTLEIKKNFPCLVVITWRYDGSTNNGMPLPAANQRMVFLEQTIADEIEKTDSCRHAISRTGSNLKELIYYVRDYDHFMA